MHVQYSTSLIKTSGKSHVTVATTFGKVEISFKSMVIKGDPEMFAATITRIF